MTFEVEGLGPRYIPTKDSKADASNPSEILKELKRRIPLFTKGSPERVQLQNLYIATETLAAKLALYGEGEQLPEILRVNNEILLHNIQEIQPTDLENVSPFVESCCNAIAQSFQVLTAEKAEQTAKETLKQIGKGATKTAFVRLDPEKSNVVLLAPNPGIFQMRNLAELQEEVSKAQTIRESLEKEDIDATRNLAVDLEVVQSEEEQVHGGYTVKTAKAEMDLETKLQGSSLSLEHRCNMGEQILQGMADLHKAGYVHGDLKPENLLVYPREAGRTTQRVKIADFGKSQPLGKEGSLKYWGNARYAPPEGSLTQKGEVHSVAVNLIRLFESPYLTKEKPMLIKPKLSKKTPPAEKRKGIERFVTEDANCPQKENITIHGKITILLGRLTGSVPEEIDLIKAEEEMRLYINALKTEMIEKGAPRNAVQDFAHLLTEMTLRDPEKRPTMQQALEFFQKLLPRFKTPQ